MTPPKTVLLSTMLAAAFASHAALAEEPAKGSTATKDEVKAADFAALKTQVEGLRDDIKKLQEFRKDLEDTVYGSKDGAAGKKDGLYAKITELEATIKKLNTDLAAMDAKLKDAAAKTTAAYTPGATIPPATAAKVRIVNDYPVEISMIVNRKSYRLNAGETKEVEVPPGSYTYELLSAGSTPVTSTIKDAETVTLRVR